MVKAKEGFDLEYWKNFSCIHFVKIKFCPMCGQPYGGLMSELKAYHCNEWHNEYTEFYLKSEADEVIRHQKYKRCMNNAWWILREEFFAEDCHDERWVNWAIRWYKRWMELAEQFKEAQ